MATEDDIKAVVQAIRRGESPTCVDECYTVAVFRIRDEVRANAARVQRALSNLDTALSDHARLSGYYAFALEGLRTRFDGMLARDTEDRQAMDQRVDEVRRRAMAIGNTP